MSRKAMTVLAVLAAAQVAMAAREPRSGASTYVNTWMDGNCYLTGSAVNVFGENATDQHPLDAAGKSISSLHYPVGPGAGTWQSFPSTSAGAEAYGMAQLDVPGGRLHLHDSGWINCGADSKTYGNVKAQSTATLTDVITLDQPARVTITGHVAGSTFGLANGGTNYLSGGIGANFVFWHYEGGEIGWQSQGFKQIYQIDFIDTTGVLFGPGVPLPSPTPIYNTVLYSADLPAGNTYFSATLDANFSLMADPGQSSSANMAFENTASFGLLVPEGVTATSSMGTPISVPEPASLAAIFPTGMLVMQRRRKE